MGSKHSASQAELVLNVIEKGLCVKCGACVGLCPYFKIHDGKVVVMDPCTSDTGRCAVFCPVQSPPSVSSPDGDAIGAYINILSARAASEEIRSGSQNGGVVTAILADALETGTIDGVIVTDTGGGHAPRGMCIEDAQALKTVSGARYSASGALETLNELPENSGKKMAVVGLPCQMAALKNRETYLKENDQQVPDFLKVGLFCTWSLDYRSFSEYLQGKQIKGKIKKYDIPPPPAEVFVVYTDNGKTELPLSEVRVFIQKGCTHCEDMASRWADISVGAFEGRDGWNTVIVRTEKGDAVLNQAVKNGVLETDHFPEENLAGLSHAAQNKMLRGKTNKDGESGSGK